MAYRHSIKLILFKAVQQLHKRQMPDYFANKDMPQYTNQNNIQHMS